jgi:DNA-directed RNA polymerase subunit RPC12/RpoP
MPTFPKSYLCTDCKREFKYRNALLMHRRFVHRDTTAVPTATPQSAAPPMVKLSEVVVENRKREKAAVAAAVASAEIKRRHVTRVTCPDCKMRLALNNLNRHREARHRHALAASTQHRRNGPVPLTLAQEADAWLALHRLVQQLVRLVVQPVADLAAEREANELKRRLAEIDALLPAFGPKEEEVGDAAQ